MQPSAKIRKTALHTIWPHVLLCYFFFACCSSNCFTIIYKTDENCCFDDKMKVPGTLFNE